MVGVRTGDTTPLSLVRFSVHTSIVTGEVSEGPDRQKSCFRFVRRVVVDFEMVELGMEGS